MQNLGDITDWVEMKSDTLLSFDGPRARIVVIDVNTPYETLFALQPVDTNDDGEVVDPVFLARVVGFDTVKFNVPPGPFDLLRIDGGNHVASIRTADGEKQHRDNIGLEKFTEIHTRRELSPEYQYVLDQVQKNQMRNMNMMGSEIEKLRRQLDAANRTPSAGASGAPAPEQAEHAPAPAQPLDGVADEGQGGSEGGS